MYKLIRFRYSAHRRSAKSTTNKVKMTISRSFSSDASILEGRVTLNKHQTYKPHSSVWGVRIQISIVNIQISSSCECLFSYYA